MSERRYQSVLLFGMPGSGKGTQGELLGSVPGYFHLATGDIFRGLDKTTELGKTFLEYSSKGELVPDDLTIKVWQQHMGQLIAEGTYQPDIHLLLLDGMPRSLRQAEAIEPYIDVLQIVHLVAKDENAMVKRMQLRAEKQGRHDDAKEDVVRNRFDVYRRETQPVLDFYSDDLMTEIDAIGSPGRVLKDVLVAVAPLQEKFFGNALE